MSDPALHHWRGVVDATLSDHERRLQTINGHIAAGAEAIHDLAVEQAETRTRVVLVTGLTAGVGSIAGSAIFGTIVYFVTQG